MQLLAPISGGYHSRAYPQPLLLIVHNNRAYHAAVMLVQRVASRRGRGTGRIDIGNVIRDPAPDYAKIAQGYGLYAEGPISDPNDLTIEFVSRRARTCRAEVRQLR